MQKCMCGNSLWCQNFMYTAGRTSRLWVLHQDVDVQQTPWDHGTVLHQGQGHLELVLHQELHPTILWNIRNERRLEMTSMFQQIWESTLPHTLHVQWKDSVFWLALIMLCIMAFCNFPSFVGPNITWNDPTYGLSICLFDHNLCLFYYVLNMIDLIINSTQYNKLNNFSYYSHRVCIFYRSCIFSLWKYLCYY